MNLSKMMNKKYMHEVLFFGLLLLVSAICYLLFVNKLGFSHDDWYLIYTGLTQGTEKFTETFIIDRPFRAPFTSFLFNLFGLKVPFYSYLAWLIRVSGAVCFYWLLRMVWPKQKYAAMLASLLFVAYPGFLNQPNAFDYQAHIWAFTVALFSICLTIKALKTRHTGVRFGLTILSIITGLLYLFLIEYNIGLEAFRFFLVWYITKEEKFLKRFMRVLKAWLPFFLSPVGFLFWRLFIFDNQRQTTDIWGMFSSLFNNTVYRGLWSLVYLIQDVLNDIVFAWVVPVYQMAFNLRLRDAVIMLAIALCTVFLVFFALRFWSKDIPDDEQLETHTDWALDMFWIGLLSVVFSLIPVILGDRHIVFSDYSRFTLPGSAGAVLVICGFIFHFTKKGARIWLPLLLLGLAVMTHFANSTVYALSAEDIRSFWWQVSWRIPQIERGTVLTVDYARTGVTEDYWAWGPANLLYYPEYSPKEPAVLDLSAIILTTDSTLAAIEQRELLARERRGIYNPQDLSKLLVLSQPTAGSCVHVLDGTGPELSTKAAPQIRLVASASKIDRILFSEERKSPNQDIFGEEPVHGWCYFYQLASLARQRGDWEEVVRLGEEADQSGLRPLDWVEWMPFLQAYAYLGETEKVEEIIPIIMEDRSLHIQTCDLLLRDEEIAPEHIAGHDDLIERMCK